MSRLGDFLEVVYGPGHAFDTVHATIHHWCNRSLAKTARGGGRTQIGRPKAISAQGNATADIVEKKLSAWMSLPNRYRIEGETKTADRILKSLVVVNGDHKWAVDDQGQVETSEATDGLDTDIARHFDHASLREYFVSLALEVLGTTQTAGRDCLRLRAVPRPGARLWPHWLPCGADEYELHADLERGVLLYIAGRCRNDLFETHAVSDVTFDEPFDDSFFIYTPSLSEQARPANPIIEHLTLEAAIARMPFTVLIPSWLPDSLRTNFEVTYHPPRSQPGRADLTIRYRGDKILLLNECDLPDPDLADMEWEQIERDGQRMAISDPGEHGGMRLLALERKGTHVAIASGLDREQLIRLGASLVAASETDR
jgi:hypothetical protein